LARVDPVKDSRNRSSANFDRLSPFFAVYTQFGETDKPTWLCALRLQQFHPV
jgi:hypothetical protein